ncbi:hypothetical protein ACFSKL_03330 [Belliella marina]|uniref:Uncharacterized protein n=1 Tax=Belliella marina TaxID=1644146 RepID=A0ABW4VIJ4_9BACT
MKWDFFYDEDKGKPYESIQDWYKDIKHLIVSIPIAIGIMVVLGIAVYLYLRFFHF